MPKIKKPRVGFRIDMTPMVDVAFLLLTFFMLTTQFRPPEEVVINLPDSHSAFKLPGTDVMTLAISKEGNIFMGVDSQQLRIALFGEQNKLKPEVLIRMDDLKDRLIQARIMNPKLRTVIRSDRDSEYGVVMDVIDLLQKVNITRFNLVTNLETNKK